MRELLDRIRLAATAVTLAILVLCPSGPAARAEDAAAPAETGSKSVLKAPDFTAKDLGGKPVKLSEVLQKGPVFVDFWTTWCKPCKLELPELDRLQRTYRKQGFTVLAVSEDDPKTVQGVKPLVEQRKWEMTVLLDPKKDVGNAFNVRNYPTSFLIAKDGTVVQFSQGYNRGDEKALEAKVVGLLGMGAGKPDSAKAQ